MEFIEVGVVLKPQGIKGELKIKPLTDDPRRFKKLRALYLNGTLYRVLSCRVDEFVYVKLEGVETRNDAEKLVNLSVKIDRVHAVPLEEDSYFIVDLLNCRIVDENGIDLGKVVSVDNYGSADVVTATNKGKTFRFPLLKRILIGVDVADKEIRVTGAEFNTVCVYED